MTDADNDITAQLVELTRQPIELYKILKFEGLVEVAERRRPLLREAMCW